MSQPACHKGHHLIYEGIDKFGAVVYWDPVCQKWMTASGREISPRDKWRRKRLGLPRRPAETRPWDQ